LFGLEIIYNLGLVRLCRISPFGVDCCGPFPIQMRSGMAVRFGLAWKENRPGLAFPPHSTSTTLIRSSCLTLRIEAWSPREATARGQGDSAVGAAKRRRRCGAAQHRRRPSPIHRPPSPPPSHQ